MSRRNFGIMSGPASLRGVSTDRPATRDSYASRDSEFDPLLPLLPRSDLTQTLLDISTLVFWALFVCVAGVGLAAAAFILLFVGVH